MPNCKQHRDCDLVCPWDGYYCHNEAHEWAWRHVGRYQRRYETMRQVWESAALDDMPDDPEAYYNERAERRA